jgi:hypothetical protein
VLDGPTETSVGGVAMSANQSAIAWNVSIRYATSSTSYTNLDTIVIS